MALNPKTRKYGVLNKTSVAMTTVDKFPWCIFLRGGLGGGGG